jgi:hypothetical protein
MSKVTVTFESTVEEDGVATTTSYQHGCVEDLSDLAWVFAEAARAGGYTMVESLCFESNGGSLTWSES